MWAVIEQGFPLLQQASDSGVSLNLATLGAVTALLTCTTGALSLVFRYLLAAKDAQIAAQEKAHTAALAALREAAEMDRAYLIQHVADERGEKARLLTDCDARLAKLEQGEAYWRDMALGLLKVQDAERRQRVGRPARDGQGGA